jgi:hypothetical protein
MRAFVGFVGDFHGLFGSMPFLSSSYSQLDLNAGGGWWSHRLTLVCDILTRTAWAAANRTDLLHIHCCCLFQLGLNLISAGLMKRNLLVIDDGHSGKSDFVEVLLEAFGKTIVASVSVSMFESGRIVKGGCNADVADCMGAGIVFCDEVCSCRVCCNARCTVWEGRVAENLIAQRTDNNRIWMNFVGQLRSCWGGGIFTLVVKARSEEF